MLDRILGLLGLFALAAIAGLLAWGAASPSVRRLIVAAWAALGSGVLGLVMVFVQLSSRCEVAGSRHGRLSIILAELRAMAVTYRRRLDVVMAGLGLSMISHGLSVLVFFLIGRMFFSSRLTTTLAEHFLMVPLTLFTTAVPLPFVLWAFPKRSASSSSSWWGILAGP